MKDIAIISEMDSRVLLYPLIQVLKRYGRVAVISDNRHITRLIDSEQEGGFCGIDIFYCEDTWDDEDVIVGYDWVVFDNVARANAWRTIIPISSVVSLNFVSDLMYMIEDESTHILKFGAPSAQATKKQANKKPEKKPKAKKGEEALAEEETVAVEETAESKLNLRVEAEEKPVWITEMSESEKVEEELFRRKAKWLPMLASDAIEKLEGEHVWPKIVPAICSELYRVLGTALCAEERQLIREVQTPDESGSNLNAVFCR